MSSAASRETSPVTVIIPHFNDSHDLERTLPTWLEQTRPPRQIIVLDDGSSPEHLERLKRCVPDDPRYQVYLSPQNQGVNALCMLGIGMATQEYVVLMGCDDWAMPLFLEKCVGQLDLHPQAPFVFVDRFLHHIREDFLQPEKNYWRAESGYLTPEEFADVLHGTHFRATAPVWRKSRIAEIGFDEEMKWFADSYATFLLGAMEGCCHVPLTLNVFGLRPNSYHKVGQKSKRSENALRTMLHKIVAPERAALLPFFIHAGFFNWIRDDFVRYMAYHPEDWCPEALALLQQPQVLHFGGRVPQAEMSREQLNREDIQRAQAALERAQALLNAGDIAGARKALEAGVALYPHIAAFRSGLADLLESTGHPAEAARHLRQLFRLETSRAEILARWARAEEKAGLDQLVPFLAAHLERCPNDGTSAGFYFDLLSRRGLVQEALHFAENRPELHPQAAELLKGRAALNPA